MRTATAYAAGIAATLLTLCLPPPASKNRKKPVKAVRAEKAMRANLSEKDIDNRLMDSFPCSDPPGWY